ncbi:MAG: hypothetical protein MK135_00855 [Polyangiaceae bacterium]|nr:hypothetical protein [Polyangiaceae bacterium]
MNERPTLPVLTCDSLVFDKQRSLHGWQRQVLRILFLLCILGVFTGSGSAVGAELKKSPEKPPPQKQEEDEATSVTGEPQTSEPAPDFDPATSKRKLGLGGALRFNYTLKTWDTVNQSRGGEFLFDTFRLNTELRYDRLIAAAEYRLYGSFGNYLKLGWMGIQFNENLNVKVGVTLVPFGLLPYASHSWFFNLGYYSGFEDDRDMGVAFHWTPENFDIRFGYFHSDEGNYQGRSLDSARYSYDLSKVPEIVDANGIVIQEASSLKEQHAGALRISQTLSTETASLLYGASGQFGGIYDEASQRYGTRWASSIFLRGRIQNLELLLEGARIERSPPSGTGPDQGIWMGAYDSAYRVARDFWLLESGLAYTYALNLGLIESIQIYDDFGVMLKDEGATTFQNVFGALLSAKYIYTYCDFAAGKNQPWIGGDWENGLAEGDPNATWEMRFNINLGLYYTAWLPLGH